MKLYFVVRLPDANASFTKSKELPARFTSKALAQETCDALNRAKQKDEAGFKVEEREGPEAFGKAS